MKIRFIRIAGFTAMFFLFYLNGFAQNIEKNAVSSKAGEWQTGENLFVGNTRFANGGPACNSCHNVSINGFVSGGALAKDLTQAISRLTADGAKPFFASNPMPMPQMQQSYSGKPLTEQEVNEIIAFLKYADNIAKTNPPSSPVASRMMIGGIAGVIALLILFSFFWMKRKQRTVNYSIFERQIKSS